MDQPEDQHYTVTPIKWMYSSFLPHNFCLLFFLPVPPPLLPPLLLLMLLLPLLLVLPSSSWLLQCLQEFCGWINQKASITFWAKMTLVSSSLPVLNARLCLMLGFCSVIVVQS